jgi:bile acid-coenzyme A ligase
VTFTYDDLGAAIASLAAEQPPAQGLGGLFAVRAAEDPDRVAIVDGDDRRAFGEVDAGANALARALEARGVAAGGRVALLLPNGAAFLEAAIATWKLGATVVPISYRMPATERDELIDLAGPTVAVDEDEFDALASEAKGLSTDGWPDIPAAPWKAIGSGGSTGRPKLIVDPGVGPTRSGIPGMFGMRPGGVQLVAGPLYHNGPFAWGLMHLMHGGTLVLAGKFDPERWLATVQAERVTWAFVVPTMLHRIMALDPDVRSRYDTSSLEVVLHSAAPCPPWLKAESITFFGAEKVWEYYGASEVPGTMIRGDDWLAHQPSVGRALPGLQVAIRDDSGEPLPPGEVGEIWLTPPGGPAFRYEGADERIKDGAVSVGDLGWLDDEGYLYISDRRTDMIITGGANVFPAEVEGVLLQHPDVGDAAVVGLSHPEWGQTVHAVIAPRDGGPLPDADGVASFVAERLASYKRPKAIEVVEALPRDPSGKLRRSAVRAEREARSA